MSPIQGPERGLSTGPMEKTVKKGGAGEVKAALGPKVSPNSPEKTKISVSTPGQMEGVLSVKDAPAGEMRKIEGTVTASAMKQVSAKLGVHKFSKMESKSDLFKKIIPQ
jgi:hypothetical protein